jgi:hypothetical protein
VRWFTLAKNSVVRPDNVIRPSQDIIHEKRLVNIDIINGFNVESIGVLRTSP